jgi:hypothetical protein
MEHKGTVKTPDYSDITCTSLMIRLTLRLRNLQAGESVDFTIRRDQRDTIEGPFSDDGYNLRFTELDGSRIHVSMRKGNAEGSVTGK